MGWIRFGVGRLGISARGGGCTDVGPGPAAAQQCVVVARQPSPGDRAAAGAGVLSIMRWTGVSYLASCNASQAAAAVVARSQLARDVGEPARRASASCSHAFRKLILEFLRLSSGSKLTRSLARPPTSLSASLAGESLATLRTETAYRALIKPSVSPIRSMNLHHNRIASKVLDRRLNAQCGARGSSNHDLANVDDERDSTSAYK